MIGILIISHGALGEALIHCAGHMLGKRPPRLDHLNVTGRDDPVLLLPRASALVKALDAGDGVLILTDMYGGTPSNITSKLVRHGKVEGLAGVNLPMLMRALTYRDRDLKTIVTKAVSGGCEGVMRIPAFTLPHAATGN